MSNPKIVARITPKQTISAKLNMHTQEIPPRTQKKTATPTTDVQTITFDEGYTGLSEVEIEAVTSSIDNNIQSENIKKNITILGVTGTVEELNAQTKNVTPSTSQQVITPDTQYNALSEVVISGVDSSIDNNIQSSNIKAGVTILGVQGNVEPDKPDQTKTANPSTQTQVITPDIGYELASVTINPVTSSIDSDIQSGNIKSGVEILGVTGSVVEKVGQNKTVTPSTSTQTIVPDTGFNALNQVEIEAIDTETKEVKSTTSQQTIYPSSGKFIDEINVAPMRLQSIDDTITQNGTKIYNPDAEHDAIGNVYLGIDVQPNLESKTTTPSASQQTIIPSSGYDGLSQVIVEAVDTETKNVKSTTQSQTIIPSTGKFIDEVVVEPLELEVKNVIPSTQSQTILPTSGKDGISQINVSAMNLQNKSVPITENGTSIIVPDTGYDGLSEVDIDVNVPTPQPSLQSKSVTITENGTTNVSADSGYDGLSGVAITTNVSGGADLSDYFTDTIRAGGSSTDGVKNSIKKLPSPMVLSGTSLRGTFYSMYNLVELPAILNTSNATTMRSMCQFCSALVSVPIYDTSGISASDGFSSTFNGCNNLSNESLNNIMRMCINAINYTGTKKLTGTLGLSSIQAGRCQNLSNYTDFVNAGWSAF